MGFLKLALPYAALAGCAAIAAFAGCAQEEYPAALWAAQHAEPAATEGGASSAAVLATCRQSRAESLPARLVAMSSTDQATANVVFVSDLFQTFTEVCAPCHTASAAPPGQGGFQIAVESDFATTMTQAVINHVIDATCPQTPNPSNPDDPMPPCNSPTGETYAARSATDPIRQFATLVEEWIQAGSPAASFTPPTSSSTDAGGEVADAGAGEGDGSAASANQYALTPSQGNAMTNIGNCVPSPGLVGTDTQTMAELDAQFASAVAQPTGMGNQYIGLPVHLNETDLVTFDSATLARTGVIAYQPAYPLWSDNAGKLRYVRVPLGQSIQFNKATQQFEIPPNTRFYKTFMKQIIDTDGSYRYQKIETRLIVSRPDQNNSDGTVTQTALYGTYQWNDDESDAVLDTFPLNDGDPFTDNVLLYYTNAPLAADLLTGAPPDPDYTLVTNGAGRHYAVPGSERCQECHMGSPSESFVLGFTPLQINRRPVGEGGTTFETGPDELTQLQRLIDYGVITGIDSPSDVLPLEQSQGTRTPRNNYELLAQGYMLGNCAHCHNPRGYPTVQNPVLLNVLDFLPNSGNIGGIFQFSLETVSPRFGRGIDGSTPIPYITPSLVDLPKLNPITGGQTADWFVAPGTNGTAVTVAYAPWRSLIYRNVDNAFAYTDDYALFPHMPMNVPGYDPTAKQVMSDWMVSIPAIRKQPELAEYAYQVDDDPDDNINGPVDTSPQPYVEVTPGSPGYDAAVAAAEARLAILHSGVNSAVPASATSFAYSRYNDPGETDDILDPAVAADPICNPIPVGASIISANGFPVPDHPHWVVTDLTQPPPPWAPRQPNWATVLVDQQVPAAGNGCTGLAGEQAAHTDELVAVSLVPSVQLSQVTPYATTLQPFGLWEQQAGCDFSAQPTVQSFTGSQRPRWMDVVNPPPNAPVYMQAPGASVFKMICINCHGPMADGTGRLAQNLATMTGGNARVADFRDGLFGPVGVAEDQSNRHAVFGIAEMPADFDTLPASVQAEWTQVTDDDRAARYMAWMGLGGTSVNIPLPVLEIVAVTKVLNVSRVLPASSLSANMLSEAKALCTSLLGPSYGDGTAGAYFFPGEGQGYLAPGQATLNRVLIPQNGDAELWLNLCAQANPHPVHVLTPAKDQPSLVVETIFDPEGDVDPTLGSNLNIALMVPAASYPAGQPVGNDRGGVDSSLCTDTASCATPNLWPWCIDDTGAGATQLAWIQSNNLPLCPASVLDVVHACGEQAGCFTATDAEQWAVHGAVNAGMAVYTYVESIENTGPAPDYDQCNLLP